MKRNKKNNDKSWGGIRIVSYKLKVAATYIPTSVACSIIGDGRLDFQVRNGAGYDPPSSPTTKRDKNILMCLSLFALVSLRLLSIVKSLKLMRN